MGRVYHEPLLNVRDRAWFNAFCARSGFSWMRTQEHVCGKVKCVDGFVQGQVYHRDGIYFWQVFQHDSNKATRHGSSVKLEPASREMLTALVSVRLGIAAKGITI